MNAEEQNQFIKNNLGPAFKRSGISTKSFYGIITVIIPNIPFIFSMIPSPENM